MPPAPPPSSAEPPPQSAQPPPQQQQNNHRQIQAVTQQLQQRPNTIKRNTISYQQSCFLRPIPSSIIFGSIATAYITFKEQTRQQKRPSNNNYNRRDRYGSYSSTGVVGSGGGSAVSSSSLLRTLRSCVGVLYVYSIMQCPMEAIQNKESYVHNGIAAFTLSYVGLMHQTIGIPFLSPYSIIHFPPLARNVLGASIYSCIAMTIAALYQQKSY